MKEEIGLLQVEFDCIKDTFLRGKVIRFFDEKVPDYFFHIPASSTGKYHPSFALGEGGLLRHTRMMVEIAISLQPLKLVGVCLDSIIVACLLHDTFKNGHLNTGYTVESHPNIAAGEFYAFMKREKYTYMDTIRKICSAINSHMGQWGMVQPENEFEKFIALCDYLASRKFFDKFPNT